VDSSKRFCGYGIIPKDSRYDSAFSLAMPDCILKTSRLSQLHYLGYAKLWPPPFDVVIVLEKRYAQTITE
jgi:hypothetical protein